MTDIAFNYEDLWYIQTKDTDDKRPKREWGGYSQAFADADRVHRHEDVMKFPGDGWAVCGIQPPEHTSWSLLIFDLDVHKADADFDINDVTIPDTMPLVRSQSGGYHVWAVVHEPAGAGSEDDFHVAHDLDWDVDIRGSYVQHHVVAPSDIPGIGGSYELANDSTIPVYFTPEEAIEGIEYRGEPLLEHDPSGATSGPNFDIDRSGDPPEEMPTCYHAGLQVRATAIDDPDYNPHRINVLTALCGAAAGYSIEEMVGHFVEQYPPNGDATESDRDQTEYQLNHIVGKLEDDQYSPPSLSTLQDAGILDEGQDCECSIPYHGGSESTHQIDTVAWEWWADARQEQTDHARQSIPDRALRYIVREHTEYDVAEIPDDAESLPWYPRNRALSWLRYEWGPEVLGIDPYDEDDDREVVQTRYSSKDESEVFTWAAVRDIYEESKERGRYAAVRLLRREHEFLTPEDTEELHVYIPDLGIYEAGAKYDIGRTLDRKLGTHYSQHEKTEILGRLKEVTVERDELEAARMDGTYVCCANGVLEIESRDLHDHDPKWLFTRRLPVAYDPDAEADEIRDFLEDITRRESDWQTMVEMVGNALLPHYDYESFMVLFGRGSNGKSTWFNVVRTFLGQDNVENIPLQDLSDNRFAPAQLLGQWANIGGDLPSQKIDDLGQLKDLTGGGEVWAEKKGQDGFNFRNRAKMMFAANEPPVLGERSYAVARRILPIRLPYRFTPEDDEHKDRDSGIEDRMKTDEELSGLLNLALDGIDRLRETDDFSLPESKQERLEYYEQFSDHIKMFAVNCLTNQSGSRERKSDLYNAYTAFCEEKGREPVSKQMFWRQVRKTTLDVDIIRPQQDDGSRERMADNLTFTDFGQQFAPHYDAPDEDGAEPLSAVAPGDESVTVEGRVTDRHTDQPDQIAEKATIVDETDEITVTVWADANKPTLEEGQAYRLKNVVVDEFDGQREVQVNQHSGIVEVQDGAGNVPTADPGANAQLEMADGGEAQNDQPADAADLEQLKPMIAKYVTEQQRNYPEGVPHELVLGEFVAEGHDPGAVESAIERAQRDGAIAEYASGGYINGS
jgi:P4 family phage/plasmid primase-like protien